MDGSCHAALDGDAALVVVAQIADGEVDAADVVAAAGVDAVDFVGSDC